MKSYIFHAGQSVITKGEARFHWKTLTVCGLKVKPDLIAEVLDQVTCKRCRAALACVR